MSALRAIAVVLFGALGLVVMASALPRFRRPRLGQRLTPYLGALNPRRSNLLGNQATRVGIGAVFDPFLSAMGERLHRIMGGGADLSERLEAAASPLDPSTFRVEQATWGLAGIIGGVVFGAVASSAGSMSPAMVLGLAAIAGVVGVVARDRSLTKAAERRRDDVRIALPTVVDMVCLAVTAGESLRGALGMVAEAGGGPLSVELRAALRTARMGTPLTVALEARARVLGLPAFDRFVTAVVAAQERGIPLADALRSIAFDLREQDKRDLIEVAGKKQVSMLVPVVALILPVAIVFAFYPGVVAIRTLAR